MKANYISPETLIVKANLAAFCETNYSTGTNDNTGGDEEGPGRGDDNEDPGAKYNPYNVWEDEL